MVVRTIDPQVEAIFKHLNDDVVTLSWKWQIFCSLFESKQRVDLFNETASSFFWACHLTFSDDVFLAISRLTDSQKSSGQDNLVVSRLLDSLDVAQHPKFHEELRKLIEVAMDVSKPFKQHRHKRLAHNDMDRKLKYTSQPLPGISFDDVSRAVKSLQDVMSKFNHYFFDTETSYKIIESSGVEALTIYLQKGVDAFENEKQQMLAAHGLTNHSG